MEEREDLKKRRLYAIVIMLIIMLLVLLLMITTISLEFTHWSSDLGDSHKHHDKDEKEDVLFTIVTSDNINLYVDAKDVTKDAVNEIEYLDIESNKVKAKIAVKSNKNAVECDYNVIFKIKENNFTNEYVNGNNLAELKEQLILKLEGYKANNANEQESYVIDLNELENNEYIIDNLKIKSNASQKYFMEHEWNVVLAFRNYRDYNQSNNAGKKITGELEFKVNKCEVINNKNN